MSPNICADQPETPPSGLACSLWSQVLPCVLSCSCLTWAGWSDCHPKFSYETTGFADFVEICLPIRSGARAAASCSHLTGGVLQAATPQPVLAGLALSLDKALENTVPKRASGRGRNQRHPPSAFMRRSNSLQAHS